MDNIYRILINNNYPRQFVQKYVNIRIKSLRFGSRGERGNRIEDHKDFVVLPFLAKVERKIDKVLGIMVSKLYSKRTINFNLNIISKGKINWIFMPIKFIKLIVK